MFCFKNYSTKKLIYSNNKRPEQFLKQNNFCNLLLEVFIILICTRSQSKWQYLRCRNLREQVTKILFLDPCHRHLTEKLKKLKKALRAQKNERERKKNMELMMSGFNSIFWHRTDFPGSFFKSEQFRTFFFLLIATKWGQDYFWRIIWFLRIFFNKNYFQNIHNMYVPFHWSLKILKKFALHYLSSQVANK